MLMDLQATFMGKFCLPVMISSAACGTGWVLQQSTGYAVNNQPYPKSNEYLEANAHHQVQNVSKSGLLNINNTAPECKVAERTWRVWGRAWSVGGLSMRWRGIWQQAPMKRTMLGWKDSFLCRSTSCLNSCKACAFSPTHHTTAHL